MIVAGEQSGTLADTLLRIGEIFEEKSDTTTKNLTTILEPLLLIVIWLGVAGVALAVILPIYNLIGGFNRVDPTLQTESTIQEIDRVVEQRLPKEEETSNASSTEVLPVFLEIAPNAEPFLTVRDIPSGQAIGEVFPGETYDILDQQSGWYLIAREELEPGWVFANFVIVFE